MLTIPTVLVSHNTAAPGFVTSNVPFVIMIANAARVKCVAVYIFTIKSTLHCAKSCVNSCKSHHHCPPGQFCCGPGKVGKCAASCVGKFCKHDYRCASRESCCSDGKCAASCVGTSCEDNSDYGTGETCCDRVKSKGKCAISCIGKSCKKYGSHCATREYC